MDVMTDFFGVADATNALIEAIYEGVLIADADAIVRYVNEGYLTTAGLQREDIIGKSLACVRPGSVLPQVIKSGQSRLGVYRHEGNVEYVVDMAPIRLDGIIIGGISVVKGIARIQRLSKEMEKYVQTNRELKAAVNSAYQARYTFKDAIGVSGEFRHAVDLARRMAGFDEDILITGESGTGKELFAQAIHNASSRAAKPFVAVNCSTLSSPLVESELFGYSGGSFTGALKGGKAGLFSVADGGTIMLDEIADLPYDMQAKLLRVLQERKLRRVGSSTEEGVDIRVIAATNKDLLTLAKEGKYREDLYYRLSAMALEIPSLRRRREDLKPLADHFLGEWCKRNGRRISFLPSAYAMMESYNWPGNIREFKNVIQFSAYTCDSDSIAIIHLPKSALNQPVSLQASASGKSNSYSGNFSGSLKKILEETEQAVILSMLLKHGESLEAKKLIAAELGISLATLYNKARR
ncbi:Fis family transcriptional regulator [Anaerosporomusa subterranea]|uniref:Fis family transcriptional regulator n=1 Tax=Anaerosporomusa subterranea TaxID=1794912 RepID=A0A154BR01_ANASB|nr:sigma 54-interacting transcriptional regulator [Anaerosporomusa subterranea]KYZ76329.1 Fis family transcriptional regulator [Anaerosporomusa subterranea]